MSSGYTRAARAATSRQVKQELVRLLFGKKYSRTGPEGHKKLDHAAYSYSDLKRAYFAQLQEIHPDKHKSIDTETDNNNNKSSSNNNKVFLELQKAWDQYEELAREMEKVQAKGQTNFTKFGVGCSFSDNDEERALRSEITDQACRGWFSSGLISEEATSTSQTAKKNYSNGFPTNGFISLVDDDLFIEVKSSDGASKKDDQHKSSRPSKTLIPGYKG